MKTYRRVEITAFSRRVVISSGEFKLNTSGEPSAPVAGEIQLRDADAGEAIDLESVDGQILLADAVRLLQQQQSNQTSVLSPRSNSTLTRWQRLRRGRLYNTISSLGRLISRLRMRRFTPKEIKR